MFEISYSTDEILEIAKSIKCLANSQHTIKWLLPEKLIYYKAPVGVLFSEGLFPESVKCILKTAGSTRAALMCTEKGGFN